MRMKKNWTNSLKDFTMNCFQTMIAVDAEIVAECIMEVFRVKIWKFLDLTKEQFVERCLIKNEVEDIYEIKNKPCDFL